MTSAFRGSDAAIVAFLSAVVAQATGQNQERPILPNTDALFIGDISTRGLKPHLSSVTDIGRNPMTDPRPNLSTDTDGDATP